MTIELRQLKYAVMAADKRSFARAAEALNTKQSSLSKKVADLEIQLGVKLFERTTSGATPTESSKNVIEAARRIVTDVGNLASTARAMSYGNQGRLSVGFCSALVGGNLPATIADYLLQHPDVQFDANETKAEDLSHSLQLRMLDVAITASDISDTGIARISLWPERVMVVLQESHPLANADEIYWSDLKREAIVMPRDGTGANLAALLTSQLTTQNLHPNLITQATSHETIINMVKVGRFITIVNEAKQNAGRDGIVFRAIRSSVGQSYLDFFAYWREDNDNPALKYFFKLLKERYPSINLG